MAKMSKKEIAYAYCENEATYGYYCNDVDCPHCPGYKADHFIAELKANGFTGRVVDGKLMAQHHNCFFPDQCIGKLSEINLSRVKLWMKTTGIMPQV